MEGFRIDLFRQRAGTVDNEAISHVILPLGNRQLIDQVYNGRHGTWIIYIEAFQILNASC